MVSSAPAQVLYGTIVGGVTDSSRAAVPGAAVKAVNKGTGQEFSTTTGDGGSYVITTVPAGAYDVTISSTGFQSVT